MSRPKGYAEWNPNDETLTLIANVQAVLQEYRAQLPMTARQIFYRLVGAYDYAKTERAYKNLCEKLVRGVTPEEDVLRLLGEAPTSTHLDKQVEAFTAANPFAERAKYLLGLVSKNEDPAMIASLNGEAAANATLALAYEQRQTRFDLYVGLENHAQRTART